MKIVISPTKGSGLGILYLGISAVILGLMIFFFIVDYTIYSVRFNRISQAMDEAVCAAALQVDQESEGLYSAFDEDNGKVVIEGIRLLPLEADNTFVNMMNENSGLEFSSYSDNLITVTTEAGSGGLAYCVRRCGTEQNCSYKEYGITESPEKLEDIINTNILGLPSYTYTAPSKLFIEGNESANKFEKRPYYMALIRGLQIDGLFIKRSADFTAFKGGKISRKS